MPTYRVVAIIKGATSHPVESAEFSDRATAQQDLLAIQKAQKEQTVVELPWLAVQGGDVLVAHVVERQGQPSGVSAEELWQRLMLLIGVEQRPSPESESKDVEPRPPQG